MELNWLQSLLYGLISGLAEFLPVSAEAHRTFYLRLFGITTQNPLLVLAVHIGAFLALLVACRPQMSRLSREQSIAAIPARRRKRQPDMKSLMDIRLLKTAAVPVIVSFALCTITAKWDGRIWILAAALVVNGILLYIPPYFPKSNKDAQSLSSLDGVLIGLGGALAVIPGVSRVAGLSTVALLRGCDREYALDTALLLCVPALVALAFIDILAIMAAGLGAVSLGVLISCILAAATSMVGGYLGITFLRFLAVKVGFSGFAYYCWGLALFTFILYLTI